MSKRIGLSDRSFQAFTFFASGRERFGPCFDLSKPRGNAILQ
jgi:hypothetical protein